MNVLRTVLDSGVTVGVGIVAWLAGVTALVARAQARNRPQPVEQRLHIPPRRR